ncbi:MAG TPA: ATP-binding protein, partial [Chloroflexota bacterium]
LDRAPVQATAAHALRGVAVIIPRTDNGAPENDLLRPNSLLVATSSHHRLPALGFVFVALCSGLLAWKLSPRLARIATALAFIRRRLTRDVEAVPATDVARETPRPSSSDRDGVEGVLVAAPATAPTTSIGTTGWNHGTVDGVPRTDLFMSVVAHELKNLMTPLIGSAQMLRSHRRLAPEQREILVATILSQAERMDRLVTDLLDVSRIESGRFVIEPRPTDLVALANMIVRERQATTSKHQIALKAPPHLDGTWDPDRLAQVLTNLIDNAIKYSPHGGTVTVEIEDQGERALVRVTDQGLGLRPDHIPLLFQPYARLAREQGIRGIGLGLYIARAIIEAHGGRIWASSPGEGFGTTFAFTLPVRR